MAVLPATATRPAAMVAHLAATAARPAATATRLAAMVAHRVVMVAQLAAMVARPGALVVHRAVWGRQEATADLTALDHQAWVVVWATIALAVWVALTATRPVVWAVQAWDLEWVPTAMVAHLTVWEAVRVATAATAVDTKYACCFKSCPIAHTTPFLFSCDLTGLFYKFVELPRTSQRVRPMKLTEDV